MSQKVKAEDGTQRVYYPPERALEAKLLERERMGLADVSRGGEDAVRGSEWLQYGTYGHTLSKDDTLPGSFYQVPASRCTSLSLYGIPYDVNR